MCAAGLVSTIGFSGSTPTSTHASQIVHSPSHSARR
jgi:hypothetical protein